jgi:HAMP domain-containing protein
MRKKLKFKIFFSFMLLVAMLAVAGTISIVEFIRLSSSVHDIVQNNYKSIEASKAMIESLEREDSAILLLLLGEFDEGRNILTVADSIFEVSFVVAKNNLTEENEAVYIKNISIEYQKFKEKWQYPIVDTGKEGNITWYKNEIRTSFLSAKKAVNELMSLNQDALYNEASILKDQSRRAVMPGIVSIIAALVFSLLLNFFISKYFVDPISDLADAVNNYTPSDNYLNISIKSDDEIKKLENAINNLLVRFSNNSKISR